MSRNREMWSKPFLWRKLGDEINERGCYVFGQSRAFCFVEANKIEIGVTLSLPLGDFGTACLLGYLI